MARVQQGQAAFGIAGLDDVLGGGLERSRLFLLEGNPGDAIWQSAEEIERVDLIVTERSRLPSCGT